MTTAERLQQKTIKSSGGSFELKTTHDRNVDFEPKLVKRTIPKLTSKIDKRIL